MSATVD